MAVIKRAEAEIVAERAHALHLGDLAWQGAEILRRAHEQAEEIVREARAEREQLIADAAETGRARGHAEGLEAGLSEGRERGRQEALAEGRAQMAEIGVAWRGALAAFAEERGAMLESARGDIVELAVTVARRVTKRAVEVDDGVALAQVGEALRLVCAPSRLRVAVSPEDEPALRTALPELVRELEQVEHAELVIDRALGPGSCVIRGSDGSEIEAEIGSQLERIIEAVRPPSAGGEA